MQHNTRHVIIVWWHHERPDNTAFLAEVWSRCMARDILHSKLNVTHSLLCYLVGLIIFKKLL
jgi:hypothetical protein